MTIRTMIVDHDPPAREGLRRLLANQHDISIVGECDSGRDAVDTISVQQPHLVFLDVELPQMSGFDVARTIGGGTFPVLVFVTARNEHAVTAFEVGAVDFLVKPFDSARLQQVLRRARDRIAAKECMLKNGQASKDSADGSSYPERFAVKSEGRIVFLQTRDVQWIDAAGNYVRLHVGTDTHLLRATMAATESWLDPERFLRIHRSIIVNLEYIAEVKPWHHGEFVVILKDGTRLNLSRSYRPRLEAFLNRCPG